MGSAAKKKHEVFVVAPGAVADATGDETVDSFLRTRARHGHRGGLCRCAEGARLRRLGSGPHRWSRSDAGRLWDVHGSVSRREGRLAAAQAEGAPVQVVHDDDEVLKDEAKQFSPRCPSKSSKKPHSRRGSNTPA